VNKFAKLIEKFPTLDKMEDSAKALIAEHVIFKKAPAGSLLFSEGNTCQGYVLLLMGTVKVQKISESGREIVLYRVEERETCIMTANCLLANSDYNAQGIAESDIELAIIPQQYFNQLLGASELFRNFVFEVYAARMSTLMMLIEEVVFKKLDERLAKLLLDKTSTNELTITHQEMATELGSVREVVSRQMKNFERQGLISLSRGKINICDRKALANYPLPKI
jgi:CRP/FNR family transcriptional regulator